MWCHIAGPEDSRLAVWRRRGYATVMRVSPADLDLAAQLADAAGAAIRPYYRAAHGLEAKADASPVTLADRAAEAAMRTLIEQRFPDDAIIGEEYGVREGTSGRAWVLDPIDGTRAFISGRPIFGTLIDHGAALATPPPGTKADGFTPFTLAAIARELSFNDPQMGGSTGLGEPEDRNVELLVADPRL